MATQNSINHISNPLASTAVTIDPGAAGDSYVQFNINTANEFRIGVDDDTGDAFKISQSGALGTKDTFVMSAAGQRTMPLQPCFLAYLSVNDTNATGDGTTFQLGSGNAFTEIFDQGGPSGDFNTNGTFTAPITGRYFFSGTISMIGISVAQHPNVQMVITTSLRAYAGLLIGPSAAVVATGGLIITFSTHADMVAADTAVFTCYAGVGTKTVSIVGTASPHETFISGILVC